MLLSSCERKWLAEEGGTTRAAASAVAIGVLLLHQANVGEGEVTSFTFALALPLAVHVNLGHFNHLAHLTNNTQKTTIHQYGDAKKSFELI